MIFQLFARDAVGHCVRGNPVRAFHKHAFSVQNKLEIGAVVQAGAVEFYRPYPSSERCGNGFLCRYETKLHRIQRLALFAGNVRSPPYLRFFDFKRSDESGIRKSAFFPRLSRGRNDFYDVLLVIAVQCRGNGYLAALSDDVRSCRKLLDFQRTEVNIYFAEDTRNRKIETPIPAEMALRFSEESDRGNTRERLGIDAFTFGVRICFRRGNNNFQYVIPCGKLAGNIEAVPDKSVRAAAYRRTVQKGFKHRVDTRHDQFGGFCQQLLRDLERRFQHGILFPYPQRFLFVQSFVRVGDQP